MRCKLSHYWWLSKFFPFVLGSHLPTHDPKRAWTDLHQISAKHMAIIGADLFRFQTSCTNFQTRGSKTSGIENWEQISHFFTL